MSIQTVKTAAFVIDTQTLEKQKNCWTFMMT